MVQQLLVENISLHHEELHWRMQEVVIAGEMMVRNFGGGYGKAY